MSILSKKIKSLEREGDKFLLTYNGKDYEFYCMLFFEIQKSERISDYFYPNT